MSVVLISVGHIANYFRRKRLASQRQSSELEEIFKRSFSGMDRARFFETWHQLSSVLEVPPDKLLPQDTISGLAKGRHMPELYLESIEIYLHSNGLQPHEIDVNLTVKELVETLIEHRTIDYRGRSS